MPKIVKVKLHARSHVHGEARNKGEIVELPELADDGLPLASVFGEIVGAAEAKPADVAPAAEEDEES
jgi:hypothetical protein